MLFYSKMAKEAQRGHDFKQVKGSSTHPSLEEALKSGWVLIPDGSANKQGRAEGSADCWDTAKHSSMYRCFMYSLAVLYAFLQGLDTHTYSITQNSTKIWQHLPAIEAVPWASYSQWGFSIGLDRGNPANKHSTQPLCPKQNSCALSLLLSKTKNNSESLANRKLRNTPSEILTRIRTSSVIKLLIFSLILVRFCKTLPVIHRPQSCSKPCSAEELKTRELLTQELLVGTVICPARKIFIYRKAFEADHYILT